MMSLDPYHSSQIGTVVPILTDEETEARGGRVPAQGHLAS